DRGYAEVDRGLDALHRLAGIGIEPCPERLMPGNDGAPGPLQHIDLDLALKAPAHGDIQGGAARVELLLQPEALLRRGAGNTQQAGLGWLQWLSRRWICDDGKGHVLG